MPSVFAGNQTHNGSFRADQLALSFGGHSAKGLLVQSINFTFGQAVSMLYEVGSEYVYYVGGRAQGTAQIGHIVGPAKFGQKLVELFRDLCNPRDIKFDASAGCGLTADGLPFRGGAAYILQDAVMTDLGVTVTSENVVINKALKFVYIDLEYQGGTGPTGLGAAAPGDIIQGGVVAPTNAAASAAAGSIIAAAAAAAAGSETDFTALQDDVDLGGALDIGDTGFTDVQLEAAGLTLETFLAGTQ